MVIVAAATIVTGTIRRTMVVPHELEQNFSTISLLDDFVKTTETTTTGTTGNGSSSSRTTTATPLGIVASSSPYDNDDDAHDHHRHSTNINNSISTSIQQAPRLQQQKQQREEVRTIRLQMISILRQKCSHSNHRLVCDLERLLWRQSKQDPDVYSDMTTLQSRLKSLMSMLLVRRWKKKKQQQQNEVTTKNGTNHRTISSNSSSSSSSSFHTNSGRAKVLLQTMGQERYQKAKMVVQAINDAKLQYVARYTKNCCGSAKTCSIRCDGSDSSPLPPVLPEALPVPVKTLYFSTRLVPIFTKTPIQQLVRIGGGGDGYGHGDGGNDNNNLAFWDKLLQEAEQNLKMFLEWKNQEATTLTTTMTIAPSNNGTEGINSKEMNK